MSQESYQPIAIGSQNQRSVKISKRLRPSTGRIFAEERKSNSSIKAINQIIFSGTSNNSAKDDDSSASKDSNFSIGKIQKMIDQKMRPNEHEMQSSQENPKSEPEAGQESSAEENNEIVKSVEMVVNSSTVEESEAVKKKVNDFTKQFKQDFKMREFVQKFTPDSQKGVIEKEKLRIIRRWFSLETFLFFVFSFVNLRN